MEQSSMVYLNESMDGFFKTAMADNVRSLSMSIEALLIPLLFLTEGI